MSKKRNLAVLMAAATVATSVAPVFAAEVKDLNEASLISEVEKLLGTKYTDPDESGKEGVVADEPYLNSVYEITTSLDSEPITSVSNLKTKIEKAKLNSADLVVTVKDKGHATVDGKVVSKEKTKNTFVEKNSAATGTKLSDVYTRLTDTTATPNVTNLVKSATPLKLNGDTATADEITAGTYETIKVELVGGKTFEVKVGDKDLDIEKGLDANGNKVNLVGLTQDSSVLKSVVGFELIELDGDATSKKIPDFTYAQYTLGTTTSIEKNVSEYYTKENGYTEAGANLINKLQDAKTKNTEVVIDGVKYLISGVVDANNTIKATNGGYELTIPVTYKENGKDVVTNIKLVVKSDKQEDLLQIKNAIASNKHVVAGRITYLSGDDRFATAASISKDTYLGKNETPKDANDTRKPAGAVVLVGENAIVDGLASAPLAHQEDAPVLLTKANEIPAETMNEIKRLVDNGADIYLIGGTTTISKDVEKQLISELNASINRVSGADRYATSSAIAEELTGSTNKQAYIVGGEGLADAMNIAPIAAKEGSPILVTPSDKLGKDAKDTLKDLKTASKLDKVTVVGGESKVTTKVLKDIKDETTFVADRLAGDTRADTNAAVIAKYFGEATTPATTNEVFVAKDGYVGGDNQLIDALAVAPTVAERDGLLVLTSDKLTSEQDKQVKDAANKTDAKMYQVGQGVGAEALKSLLKIFGL